MDKNNSLEQTMKPTCDGCKYIPEKGELCLTQYDELYIKPGLRPDGNYWCYDSSDGKVKQDE